ncbi:hypothetical protein AVEN_38295-1 [Araneus ventricosus]|uniref:Uncharacterized protein n=1 Tax=Araneus ventricosus TaxID=182803 RepID=A0A4Y2E4N4_ARAVE|nr:hypothetical protein AVEN_38295-1 [Araneus ventricosus]
MYRNVRLDMLKTPILDKDLSNDMPVLRNIQWPPPFLISPLNHISSPKIIIKVSESLEFFSPSKTLGRAERTIILSGALPKGSNTEFFSAAVLPPKGKNVSRVVSGMWGADVAYALPLVYKVKIYFQHKGGHGRSIPLERTSGVNLPKTLVLLGKKMRPQSPPPHWMKKFRPIVTQDQ